MAERGCSSAGNFLVYTGLVRLSRWGVRVGSKTRNLVTSISGLQHLGKQNSGQHIRRRNGCHVVEVEIDEGTGEVEIVRYHAVEDVGHMINPLLVAGQLHGGIAQGVGQALMENIVYDSSGQLVSGSFMDYAMPRADDFCPFNLAENEVPTQTNPLGVKGAGESGTVGALPAVMNAINHALAQIGAPYVQMPATPEKVWRAIAAGRDGMAMHQPLAPADLLRESALTRKQP
jgi:carbon-monoxide dehydrogenase large subunit